MQINPRKICPEDVTKAVSQFLSSSEINNKKLYVLAIYSMCVIFMDESKRYTGKVLTSLESHSRSKSLGDIDINNANNSCFESIEIKHNKPITADMVGVAYRKIKKTTIDRYYILTTNEPNFDDYESVMQEIEKCKNLHPCQIIVNGVIPSLKYYLRLTSNPQSFVDGYTQWLEFEFRRASGIKREHLRVWQEIRQNVLNLE